MYLCRHNTFKYKYMILERLEKDGLVKAIYESSNIVASSYDKVKKDLNVTFKNGGNYTYQDVPETDYMRFETAESQGKVLNSNLKKYPFLKHDKVDVNKILEQIKDINEAEVTAMEVGVISKMKDIVTNYDNNQTYDSVEVDKLTSIINTLNEMTK